MDLIVRRVCRPNSRRVSICMDGVTTGEETDLIVDTTVNPAMWVTSVASVQTASRAWYEAERLPAQCGDGVP